MKVVLALCLSIGLATGSRLARAAEVPHVDQEIVVNARELSVELFLSEVFGQIGVPVRVADEIIGSVNGDFSGPAREIINNILSTFQLAVYFDGAVAHVYPSNDLVHKVVYMPGASARKIQRAAQKLGMLDPHNTVSAAEVGLVVTGAQRFVDQVERLVTAMQKKTEVRVNTTEIYRSFQLNYAWADDMPIVIGGREVVMPGVASIIRTIIGPGALGNDPAHVAETFDAPGSGGFSSDPELQVSLQSARKSADAAAGAVPLRGGGDTRNTRIVADPLTNSIIIRDRADRMHGYEELIKTLDKEPQMIEIEATIIDLDTERMRELGVNWRGQVDDSEVLLGNGSQTDELLNPGANVTPSGEGGWVSLVLGNRQQFIARINALEKQGAARIISKPHVMTLSNVEALLNTTSTFFVRLEGQEEVDLRDVTVGTTLRVTPHVYERGGRTQIKLRINIQDGAPSSRVVDELPVIDNSEVNTQAIIDVGQSLLIGGLVRESVGNGVSRVPVLGRIPGLGALFRTNTKSSNRTERMFLITPRVKTSKSDGKRLEAPILSGAESDIILSSPGRMNRTRETLRALDETYSTVQSMPEGDSLSIKDNGYAEPFQPLVPVDVLDTDVEREDPSLRERVLRQQQLAEEQARRRLASQPATAQPVSTQAAETRVQPAVSASSQMLSDSDGDGWQAVSSAGTRGGVTTAVQAITPAEAKSEQVILQDAPSDDDGWQLVGQ